jgi:ABC-2 type transport system permease protein
MNIRVLAIAQKEVFQLLRDKKVIPMILILPIIQVILFGYVAATDVKNIKFGVLDQDKSSISRQIVSKIEKSGFFINQGLFRDYPQLERAIDSGKVRIGLVIPAGFNQKLLSRKQPALQVIIDGTDSNTASIAQNYFLTNINSLGEQIMKERLAKTGVSVQSLQPVALKYRVYYNPEQRSVNYMVPAVTALVLLLITTMLTALSIVKEKEAGTIEQIMVTPVKPWEFILGKLLPFPFIGLVDVFLVVAIGALWFAVPIKGSILLLMVCSALFLLTTLGMGLLISTVSSTQQQAMLSTIFFLIPNILLSGFIFPVSNMPKALQWITIIIPARYFIEIIRGIYLKGIGIDRLYPQMLALAVIGVLILAYSVRSFRKQLV